MPKAAKKTPYYLNGKIPEPVAPYWCLRPSAHS